MRRKEKWKYRQPRYYKGRDLRSREKVSHIWLRICMLLLTPLSIGLLSLCRVKPNIAEEVFAKRIYKWISIPYSKITSLIPISITEIIYILFPIFVIIMLIRFIIRMFMGKESRALIATRFLLNVGVTLSILFFFYTILCGVNYYRYSFTYYSGLTVKEQSIDIVYELCDSLIQKANDLREKIPKTDPQTGVFELSTDSYQTGKKARDAMNHLSKEYNVLAGWKAVPKKVLLSKYMSYTEITGIFFPFTMESNVNVDISDYSIPVTMCHELSHLRGFMREDEANFIAFLACIESEDIELQYSGTMLGLIYAGNALYKMNPSRYNTLRDKYSTGVSLDLDANRLYWSKYEDTVISTVSNQVNDTYLKANDQKDGVLSYGRMVDLLLAWYEKSK